MVFNTYNKKRFLNTKLAEYIYILIDQKKKKKSQNVFVIQKKQ